ncbi:bone morphogenetic protein 2-like [Palaemon carinicauda]|uniref:bone morphogenetic protein 2-like n=1 Tax=Palaemon carinicauda TaxID=392227 RepID=UPI0035B5C51A
MSLSAVITFFRLFVIFQTGNIVFADQDGVGYSTAVGNIDRDVEDVSFTTGPDLDSTVVDELADDPWDMDLFGNLQNSTADSEEQVRRRRSIRVPGYMWQKYDHLSEDIDSVRRNYCGDKTYVSFPNEEAKSFRGCGDRNVWFDLRSRKESFDKNLIIQSAELHVELLPKKNGRRGPKDHKFSVVKIAIYFQLGRTTETLKQEVNFKKKKEVSFDVTPFVKRYLKDISIGVHHRLDFNVSFQLPKLNSETEKLCRYAKWAPSLLVSWESHTSCHFPKGPLPSVEDQVEAEDYYTTDEDYSEERTRRDLPGRSPRELDLCRRVPLEVSFQDIGWNAWVIAPESYNAYHCVGRCSYPLPNHRNPTSHAVILTLLKELQITEEGSCCVPTAFEPLQMLYYDRRNKVVLKVFKEMVATKCGCL